MRNRNKHIALFILLIVIAMASFGQVNRTKMVGAYVYNFSRYTTWPNETKLDSFRIVLVSSDKGLVEEFNAFSKNLKAKGKAISINVRPTISMLKKPHPNLIFIDNLNSGLLPQVLKLIGDEPILVVTENSADKQHVMINLYDSPKQELLFEVNKANTLNQNLKIDPEILLLGGTEIDVAGLFRTSQKEMEQLQIRFRVMNDSLDELNGTITKSLLQIEKQQAEMKRQENQLTEQGQELVTGKMEIEKQKSQVASQYYELIRQKEQMNEQSEAIKKQLINLTEQQKFIDHQQIEIKNSKAILDSLVSEISSKNLVLNEQTLIIDRQKQILILAVIAGILALIVLISIVNGYRSKIKKNRLLTKQKDEIEVINKKLVSTNKSLYQTLGQLKETQSQLVSSEKMASLGVLTAGIAHEINNPVNFVFTGVNSLRNDYNDLEILLKEIQGISTDTDANVLKNNIVELRKKIELDEIIEIIPQTIDDIHIGAERAADIIRGLRNFSRIDKDSKQLTDIHEGIDSSLLLLRNKFKNHIRIDKHYSQLPKIECFPGKLNQVFMNIISNSIDAIEKEGVITITTQADDERITIKIEDNGKGISPENLTKIFDPFFTTKSVGKGVGLGLSITFGIVQEHGGTIDVKSVENDGTIFTISLPCKQNN